MPIDPRQVRKGMIVRNPQGHKMGTVIENRGEHFRFRAGRILPDEYWARTRDILEIRDDEIVLLMRGTIEGELNEGRHSGSRGVDVARRQHDERLL